MNVEARRAEFAEIEPMRGLYRQEANCQIVHDSILGRGLADGYLILVDGRVGGYGGIWNKYSPGQVMEFHTLPEYRRDARSLFREFLLASRATSMEAQTNMPLMTLMLFDFATEIVAENVLFADLETTRLECPGSLFRAIEPRDAQNPDYQPDSAYVLEVGGKLVASGGFLCHYNPPYGDVYMDVWEPERGKGYGSYIVQEVKRVCYQDGKRPSARCNASNHSSRRTLEKAGMLPVGRLLVGQIALSP
jgi:GNAT superfamily N-acetyltransferase